MTDRYAVIGHPISHSKSPLIHQMFAAQTGQDIRYAAIESPLDGFAATIQRLREAGYKGCNVTVPFKFEAFNLATELSERARAAQAVNTLSFNGEVIRGDNTDGTGLVRDIAQNIGIQLENKQVLLLGAGGAAYGVAQPLLQAGVRLTIENRTKEKAELLAARLSANKKMLVVVGYQDNTPIDVIINATSSGLSDEMPTLPLITFAPNALAYDMMYGRETPFMRFAQAQKISFADGLGMLVEQAAESFYLWRGVRPATAPVIAALRTA